MMRRALLIGRMNGAAAVILALIIQLAPCPVLAEMISGLVVGVHDGDTLTLLTEQKERVKVRLAEIDTPEKKQPYGSRAKQALSDLAYDKDASVDVQNQDRYGRKVGRVSIDNLDVNAELVRSGAAWVYRQYLRDKSLLHLEAEAKQEKRGLWALSEAERMPPWEWRRQQKAEKQKRSSNDR